jgi:hypothetical protein
MAPNWRATPPTSPTGPLAKLHPEVAQILNQAAEADQRENEQHGTARGDELPAALASKAHRLARPRQAAARLEADAATRQHRHAQRQAAADAAAVAKGRTPRPLKPRPRDEAPQPEATDNVTDPDSRLMHTRRGRFQGYNAQAVSTGSGGSCAAGWGRARRSGSCYAAPTTCSSCGGTGPRKRSSRQRPADPAPPGDGAGGAHRLCGASGPSGPASGSALAPLRQHAGTCHSRT